MNAPLTTPDHDEGPLVPSHWTHLLVRANYSGPKEFFSASQLESWDGCQRKWAFRYLWGLREPEGDGQRTGTAGHKQLELYMQGRPLDQNEPLRLTPTKRYPEGRIIYPGQIALPAVQYLPDRRETSEFYTEHPINIDTRYLMAGIEPIQFTGSKDLFARHHSGTWAIWDYKFIKDVEKWAKPIDVLRRDIQGSLYAIDVALNKAQDEIPFRWIYIQTDPDKLPKAERRDVIFQREAVMRRGHELMVQACLMRDTMRERADPRDLPPSHDTCTKYGRPGQINCKYHVQHGGPCDPGISHLGDRLVTLELRKPKTQTPEKESTPMTAFADLSSRLAAIRGNGAPVAAAAQPAPVAQVPIVAPVTAPAPLQPPPVAPIAAAPPAFAAPVQSHVLPPEAALPPAPVAPIAPVALPAQQPVPMQFPPGQHVVNQPIQVPPGTVVQGAPVIGPPASVQLAPFVIETAGVEVTETAEQAAEKQKRHRRTKAEIEAERAAEAAKHAPASNVRDQLAAAILANPSLCPNLETVPYVFAIADEALKAR